ncbi:MAG: hypothetical protein QOH46_1803 [Solirubrobacteraceae bacterium]|nr:hypothetical protein [Solirubrobacteraceae bacterium]
MTRPAMTWARALRALAVACALVLVLTFVAANFVLVDVRLWGLNVQTRLAWAAVAPGALGFAAGVLFSRTRRAARGPEPARTSTVIDGSDETPPARRSAP